MQLHLDTKKNIIKMVKLDRNIYYFLIVRAQTIN